MKCSTACSRSRKDRRAFTLWELIVVVAIISALIVIILRALNNPGYPPAQSVQCLARIRQIGMAIVLYRHENNGIFPPNLAVLSTKILPETDVFICPSSGSKVPADRFKEDEEARRSRQLDFVYVGEGLGSKCKPNEIILVEPIERHSRKKMTNVCFADGSARTIKREEAIKLIEPLRNTIRLTDEEYQFLIAP